MNVSILTVDSIQGQILSNANLEPVDVHPKSDILFLYVERRYRRARTKTDVQIDPHRAQC